MWEKNILYSKIVFISQNFEAGEGYGQKTNFGVPVLDCLYLLSGTCPKSENQIVGVFLSKFFAACQEKCKNGRFRAKKNISHFWFFKKISPKIQNFETS